MPTIKEVYSASNSLTRYGSKFSFSNKSFLTDNDDHHNFHLLLLVLYASKYMRLLTKTTFTIMIT